MNNTATPEFTPFERQLEDRRKYRPFFQTERELELFLRLPLGSEEQRDQYLRRVVEEIKNEAKEDKKVE
jgi:hypothetical protein